VAGLFGALVGFPTSCRQGRDTRPNVLLVVVDTLRADHVGAYGSPYEVSPNVDGLAARSVLFLRTRPTPR
jgi:arylsulfatase A-like enzyme